MANTTTIPFFERIMEPITVLDDVHPGVSTGSNSTPTAIIATTTTTNTSSGTSTGHLLSTDDDNNNNNHNNLNTVFYVETMNSFECMWIESSTNTSSDINNSNNNNNNEHEHDEEQEQEQQCTVVSLLPVVTEDEDSSFYQNISSNNNTINASNTSTNTTSNKNKNLISSFPSVTDTIVGSDTQEVCNKMNSNSNSCNTITTKSTITNDNWEVGVNCKNNNNNSNDRQIELQKGEQDKHKQELTTKERDQIPVVVTNTNTNFYMNNNNNNNNNNINSKSKSSNHNYNDNTTNVNNIINKFENRTTSVGIVDNDTMKTSTIVASGTCSKPTTPSTGTGPSISNTGFMEIPSYGSLARPIRTTKTFAVEDDEVDNVKETILPYISSSSFGSTASIGGSTASSNNKNKSSSGGGQSTTGNFNSNFERNRNYPDENQYQYQLPLHGTTGSSSTGKYNNKTNNDNHEELQKQDVVVEACLQEPPRTNNNTRNNANTIPTTTVMMNNEHNINNNNNNSNNNIGIRGGVSGRSVLGGDDASVGYMGRHHGAQYNPPNDCSDPVPSALTSSTKTMNSSNTSPSHYYNDGRIVIVESTDSTNYGSYNSGNNNNNDRCEYDNQHHTESIDRSSTKNHHLGSIADNDNRVGLGGKNGISGSSSSSSSNSGTVLRNSKMNTEHNSGYKGTTAYNLDDDDDDDDTELTWRLHPSVSLSDWTIKVRRTKKVVHENDNTIHSNKVVAAAPAVAVAGNDNYIDDDKCEYDYYPVHKSVMAVGPRKSNFFAREYKRIAAAQKQHLQNLQQQLQHRQEQEEQRRRQELLRYEEEEQQKRKQQQQQQQQQEREKEQEAAASAAADFSSFGKGIDNVTCAAPTSGFRNNTKNKNNSTTSAFARLAAVGCSLIGADNLQAEDEEDDHTNDKNIISKEVDFHHSSQIQKQGQPQKSYEINTNYTIPTNQANVPTAPIPKIGKNNTVCPVSGREVDTHVSSINGKIDTINPISLVDAVETNIINNLNSTVTQIDLDDLAADAVPFVLDYIYNSAGKLEICTEHATALYYLSKLLDIRSLQVQVERYWRRDLIMSTVLVYYQHSRKLEVDTIISAAEKLCAQNLFDLDECDVIRLLQTVDASFMYNVVSIVSDKMHEQERNIVHRKALEGTLEYQQQVDTRDSISNNTGSDRTINRAELDKSYYQLSLLLAVYCNLHKRILSPDVFWKLTDSRHIPKLDPKAAKSLLDTQDYIVGPNLDLTSLTTRCIAVLSNHWDKTLSIHFGQLSLAEVARAVTHDGVVEVEKDKEGWPDEEKKNMLDDDDAAGGNTSSKYLIDVPKLSGPAMEEFVTLALHNAKKQMDRLEKLNKVLQSRNEQLEDEVDFLLRMTTKQHHQQQQQQQQHQSQQSLLSSSSSSSFNATATTSVIAAAAEATATAKPQPPQTTSATRTKTAATGSSSVSLPSTFLPESSKSSCASVQSSSSSSSSLSSPKSSYSITQLHRNFTTISTPIVKDAEQICIAAATIGRTISSRKFSSTGGVGVGDVGGDTVLLVQDPRQTIGTAGAATCTPTPEGNASPTSIGSTPLIQRVPPPCTTPPPIPRSPPGMRLHNKTQTNLTPTLE